MRVYLVGGAVRDRLLGLPVRERDWVVVGAQPQELRAGCRHLSRASQRNSSLTLGVVPLRCAALSF